MSLLMAGLPRVQKSFHIARMTPDDAAESHMADRRIDPLRHGCGRPIAPTVVRGTEVGATLSHLARNAVGRCRRIEALLAVAPRGLSSMHFVLAYSLLGPRSVFFGCK